MESMLVNASFPLRAYCVVIEGEIPFKVKSSISASNKSNQVWEPRLRWFEFTGVRDN